MPDELEERLRSHASAFDSLLSLIPAKLYYGEDVSDQWKRKKQTPEQKRAAKMAKLDPDNAKSAKDVMNERAAAALKRKRAEDGEDDYDGPTEKQREGLKLHDHIEKRRKTDKKQPASEAADEKSGETSVEDRKRREAERKAAKKGRKQARKLKAQQKAEKRKAHKEAAASNDLDVNSVDRGSESEEHEDDEQMVHGIDMDENKVTAEDKNHSTASPSPAIASPMQSPQLHSGSSSISSILPPSTAPDHYLASKSTTSNFTQPLPTSADPFELTPQQRIEARIAALRAERKADGADGHPPRNRQELLEARRRKEQQRREDKKELRRKAKEEEIRKQEEEIARRFSPGGSGSLIASPRSPVEPGNNFSFGRVAFGDGTHVDSSLSTLLDPHKKKGASDIGTALKAAQNKAFHLSGLDEAKRANIEEKDMWLNAKRKAHGERVKDDTSLLKKALKRQESSKKKSEKEWQGRIEGVAKSQEARQRKRQENIAKRREEKGGGGKKKSKGGAGAGKKAKVKRPGFEGSFKTKPGGGGKK